MILSILFIYIRILYSYSKHNYSIHNVKNNISKSKYIISNYKIYYNKYSKYKRGVFYNKDNKICYMYDLQYKEKYPILDY